MKVRELIELLESYDPDAEVHIAQPTNDYWKHVKVVAIDDVLDLPVEQNDYCSSLVLNEDSKKSVVTILQAGII